jgi:ubiquinol-cytochrome c reductase cytochrome c1 subunit
MLNKLICMVTLLFALTGGQAAENNFPLDTAPDLVNDLTALQNGAKIFVNYCLSCHSASSMRYNKLQEIGLTDKQIEKNLLFTGKKISDMMNVAITPEDAKKWFGVVPPDLSLIARAKSTPAGPSGADYIYTYMRTFYRDTTRPIGWNNLVSPNAAMPHVLWEQQGPREVTITAVQQTANGSWEQITTHYDEQGFAQIKQEPSTNLRGQATLTGEFKALDPQKAANYDKDMADLTAFLSWMAEPHQLLRKQLGVWVLLFLGLFLLVAWRLNASYWKHVR